MATCLLDSPAEHACLTVDHMGDLFTPRQLVALTTFSDLVAEAMERVERDAANADLPNDERPLRDGSTEATAYAEAIGVYLAFAIDKGANYWSSSVLGIQVPRNWSPPLDAKHCRWFGTIPRRILSVARLAMSCLV